jgi:hypothetical protein
MRLVSRISCFRALPARVGAAPTICTPSFARVLNHSDN